MKIIHMKERRENRERERETPKCAMTDIVNSKMKAFNVLLLNIAANFHDVIFCHLHFPIPY